MVQFAISNIVCRNSDFDILYEYMTRLSYTGLEIAPTKIFPESPYDKCEEAKGWGSKIRNEYGFVIPSMQSIWYGRKEMLFGTDEERTILLEYTKKAILFAEAIGCKNLVFGCPKNRNMPMGIDEHIAIRFFWEIGDFAHKHDTTIGMEANPEIYGTNYINDTASAINLIEKVDSKGFLLNLDIGTMIENGEKSDLLLGKEHLINHIHVSEPGLKKIVIRDLHNEIAELLRKTDFNGFVSIEMGQQDELDYIEEVMCYVKEVFGDEKAL